MMTYIVRRVILAVIVLLLVTVMVFFAMRLLPGDPVRMIISFSSQQTFSDEQIAQIRHENGLDRSLITQYFDWLGKILHGDLGKSILYKVPVMDDILGRLPVTVYIGLIAYLVGLFIGIPTGVICAVRRGKPIDTVLTTLANIGITIPTFWLGIMMMYVFALKFKWLPLMGYTSPFTDYVLSTKQLIMPVICEALFGLAANARQARSSMLEVLHQDYMRTAWSKGLKERLVISRHALKNGLIPILTLSGMGLSMIIGGSVIIEKIFVIPGMGMLTINSMLNQDYPYVQAIALIDATMILVINLLVDLSYGWLDPRIRYS
jgi:peptide/nickel transport system permease protein